MTKKEQIEEMAKAIPKGADYDNNECYIIGDSVHIAKTLYNAGYRKIDEFAECRNCSAWSGTDCTRHPYIQGCLKDETNVKDQAVEEIALLKSELKQKSSISEKVSAPKEQIDDGFENYDKLKSQIAFFKEETERAKLSLNKKIEEYNQLSFRFCQQSYEKYKLLSNFAEKLKDKFKEFDSRWIVYSKIDELLKEYKNDN